MTDLSQQSFYEYSPDGDKKPTTSKERSPRLLFIIVSLVVVIVFGVISFFGVRAFQNRSTTKSVVDSANVQIEAEVARCALDSDQTACESRAKSRIARESGLVSVCDGVKDTALRSCVSLIANDAKDAELCKSLNDNDRAQCESLVYTTIALENSQIKTCESIPVEELKQACVKNITQRIVLAGTCVESGIDPELCDMQKRIEDSATGDPELCKTLVDAGAISSCLDYITSIDKDGDGLSAFDEFSHGTSDTEIDTDADGFSDFEEITNGFDPLS